MCRSGDIASLCVEAVVNPTNEGLTDKNPVSTRLFEMAGPELRDECKNQIGCMLPWQLSLDYYDIRVFCFSYCETECIIVF